MKNVFKKVVFTKPFTNKGLVKQLAIIIAFVGALSICSEKARATIPYYYLAGSAVGTVIRKGVYEKRKREGTLAFVTIEQTN